MLAVLSLIAELGHDVVVDGKVATVIAQHLTTTVPGKRMQYFDVPGNPQTIAYVPKEFDCKGPAVLEARVIAVKGGGKRQKSEEVFTEAQLDVTKWRCLPASIDELLDEPDAQHEIISLGRAAIPGLVRHSDRPQAVKLLEKIIAPEKPPADWVKWWRANWHL